MPRTDFDRSLKEVQDQLLVLGSMVEKSIDRSVLALKNRDLSLSKTVIDDDDLIDDLRNQIEEKCISVIATQNPMAGDLRTVISVLYIAEELERMGDYAEGIAKISVSMDKEPMLKPLVDIPRMADKSSKMLSRSLDALVNRDEQLAIQVCKDDSEVDELYNQVYRELLTFMISDPKTIERATYLLWVSHNIERIADRATNISERVLYLITGKIFDIHELVYGDA
ncbi:MAG: phosphate signaling complex protein PhoU [SAR202 cluster bacterium]|nr:phosphate transport system regulatory protein PhoU [Chloroflexota bacterium]MQG39529.1 phosphate signaling complex protein PhoU [SAR202 cluster bacterium]|tara:strand:- start:15 stop:689 length:675 start_codon:yes stop_codon:yes gene_type:complete